MRRITGWIVLVWCTALPVFGWGNRGHELVAYLGYIHADSDVQARIDELVALNPCYSQWQAAVAQDAKITTDLDKRAAVFMQAATWPDMIKHGPVKSAINPNPYTCHFTGQTVVAFADDKGKSPAGGTSADVPPTLADGSPDPADSQNTGYADTRRHQYWHFIDLPDSLDGTATTPAMTPNAETELALLTAALAEGSDASLNSYDLVWIAHLMGDLHQPLHDVTGFSKALKDGDEGGNLVHICPTASPCGTRSPELHGTWDDLPGGSAALNVVIKQAKSLDAQTGLSAGKTDFAAWGNESFELAQKDAYAAPFNTGSAVVISSDVSGSNYMKTAHEVANSQIALAGLRLAQVLNAALKDRQDSCCKMPR